MESVFEKIIRKTGRKPSSCKCVSCKSQCMRSPCLGTPQDIEKIIDAGYGDRIFATEWGVRVMQGLDKHPIRMYQAELTEHGCTFFKNGLCELHNYGLKPTEGKLSHHTITHENYDPKKHLSYNVAKTWLDDNNVPVVQRIIEKINTLKTKKLIEDISAIINGTNEI